jgi:endoglucanase
VRDTSCLLPHGEEKSLERLFERVNPACDDVGMAPDGRNEWLRRGISFGNALDTDRGEQPRLRLRERYFGEVRRAGFDTVRLPVRWSAHADNSAPYTIDPAFGAHVDRAVDHALRRDLTVVLNVHHYHELQATPHRHEARFVALWRQIAARYAGRSGRLCFELLNEPRDAITPPVWNRLWPRAHSAVRASHPDRPVIIGPARMNDVGALPELDLPEDDHVIATIHYYAPFELTHQGAPWLPGADRWLGTTWGDDADRAAVRADLTNVASWANGRGRPLLVGEFGTYDKADVASRLRWTAFVRSEAERLGLGWCYWDFGTDFGAFDPRRDTWREPLLNALLPP